MFGNLRFFRIKRSSAYSMKKTFWWLTEEDSKHGFLVHSNDNRDKRFQAFLIWLASDRLVEVCKDCKVRIDYSNQANFIFHHSICFYDHIRPLDDMTALIHRLPSHTKHGLALCGLAYCYWAGLELFLLSRESSQAVFLSNNDHKAIHSVLAFRIVVVQEVGNVLDVRKQSSQYHLSRCHRRLLHEVP